MTHHLADSAIRALTAMQKLLCFTYGHCQVLCTVHDKLAEDESYHAWATEDRAVAISSCSVMGWESQ